MNKGREIVVLDREIEAVKLRLSGKSFSEIGHSMGVTRQRAFFVFSRAMRRSLDKLREETDFLRQLESERLDALHCALWPLAISGDYVAADKILKIMDQRAKLFGLYRMHETKEEEQTVFSIKLPAFATTPVPKVFPDTDGANDFDSR